jgi:hypothetical protein
LVVKVTFDFTKVSFSSWKIHDSSRTDSDRSKFLPPDWIAYQEEVPLGEPLNWRKLADAVGYFGRCYLVERVRIRVFNE